MNRKDLTTKINPPKFKVGKFVLNEYEAREMVARIAEGKLNPKGIILIDEDGKKFTFNTNGSIKENYRIKNWDINSEKTIRKFKANKVRNELRFKHSKTR